MIKIYQNGNEFISDNIDFFNKNKSEINIFFDYAPLINEFSRNKFLIKIKDEDNYLFLMYINPYNLVLYGDNRLSYLAANTLCDYNLEFSSILAQKDLALEFLFHYENRLGGSHELKYDSDLFSIFDYTKGSIKTLELAGGCFWCVSKPYYEYEGVNRVISGFAGGKTINPSYDDVKLQLTGHRETILIEYDSDIITYKELLDIYFSAIDPYDDGGQFIDRGESYTLAIFSDDIDVVNYAKAQIKEAEMLSQRKCYIGLLSEQVFYKAEEYHQDFALKEQEKMKQELASSGRSDKLFDFNFNVAEGMNILTTLFGKRLVLEDISFYDGPITMQYLPYGGIQSVYGFNLIINTKNGLIVPKSVIYDGVRYDTNEFVKINRNLVNLVLPN